MLSSDYIHDLIKNTDACSNADVKNLLELVELYPYVSTFSILYLKALANSKDIRLESEIEKYAYRISSRAVLYELLHESLAEDTEVEIKVEKLVVAEIEPEKATESIVKPEPEIEIESQDEEIVEVEEIAPETLIETEISPEVKVEIETVLDSEILTEVEEIIVETEVEQKEIFENDTIEAEIEAEFVQESIEENFEVEAVEKVVSEKKEVLLVPRFEVVKSILEETKTDEQELDQLIQSSALAANFVLSNFEEEKQEEIVPETIDVKIPEIEPEEQEIEKEISNDFTEAKIQEKTTNLNERSFSSWLHFGESEVEKVVEAVEEKLPESIEEPKKIEYYNFEKPKKEFFSPAKKAKESIDENKMPVSETLAKIFALQGNYPKSIYVYEQLILIFPEKKSFFATQIKNLKKKLNS